MATGLKRDPVVILRIDGEELDAFLSSPLFEQYITSIFATIQIPDGSFKDYFISVFEKLSIDQGMPPATDPWVMSNIIEPALESLEESLLEPLLPETLVAEFRRVAGNAVKLLKEQPAIVVHNQTTFDGSGIKRLLSTKFELDKTLYSAAKSVPRDENGRISKEHFGAALEFLAASVGLPPLGLDPQCFYLVKLLKLNTSNDVIHIGSQRKRPLYIIIRMDKLMRDTLNTFDCGDGSIVREDEFKKVLTEILGNLMLQLEANPVSVSINSVVHEEIDSQPSSS